MNFEKIIRFLNFKIFFFLAISLSLIGFILIFSKILLINGFPFDFIGIEVEILDDLPISYLFIPLLFWNVPLVLVIIARLLFKRSQ